MTRVVSLELIVLSIAIAWLLGLSAYTMSTDPVIELIVPGERPAFLKLTKVFFWASSAAVIAAILTAAAAVHKQYRSILVVVSVGVLALVVSIAVVWSAWFLFAA